MCLFQHQKEKKYECSPESWDSPTRSSSNRQGSKSFRIREFHTIYRTVQTNRWEFPPTALPFCCSTCWWIRRYRRRVSRHSSCYAYEMAETSISHLTRTNDVDSPTSHNRFGSPSVAYRRQSLALLRQSSAPSAASRVQAAVSRASFGQLWWKCRAFVPMTSARDETRWDVYKSAASHGSRWFSAIWCRESRSWLDSMIYRWCSMRATRMRLKMSRRAEHTGEAGGESPHTCKSHRWYKLRISPASWSVCPKRRSNQEKRHRERSHRIPTMFSRTHDTRAWMSSIMWGALWRWWGR